MSVGNSRSRRLLRSPVFATGAALAIEFLAAYAASVFLFRLQHSAESTFNFEPVILLSAAMPFFVAALSLAFAWLVLIRLPRSPTAALLAIAVGVLVPILYLSLLPAFPDWLRRTPLDPLRSGILRFGSQSSIYYLSASWVVVGIVGLIRRADTGSDRLY